MPAQSLPGSLPALPASSAVSSVGLRLGDESPSDEDDSDSKMTPGTVAGICVAVVVFFLGAAALFVVYWRRQRRFDQEDEARWGAYGGRPCPADAGRSPYYYPRDPKDTIFESQVTVNDYRMPAATRRGGGGGGPREAGGAGRSESHALPLSKASTEREMPAHPKYILRPIHGRGSPVQHAQPDPSFGAPAQPEPAVVPAPLDPAAEQASSPPPQGSAAAAAAAAALTSRSHRQAIYFPASAAPRAGSPAPDAAPSLAVPAPPHLRGPPAHGSPPPPLAMSLAAARGGRAGPVEGREDSGITGPLPFPWHEQGLPPLAGDEAAAAGVPGSQSGPRKKRKEAPPRLSLFGKGKDGADGSGGQVAGPRWRYEEVPLGSGKSELYG